jgi:hypothetical protein
VLGSRLRYDIADRPYIVKNSALPTIAELADLEAPKAYLSNLHKLSIEDPDEFADFASHTLQRTAEEKRFEVEAVENAQPFNQPRAFANAEVFSHWAQIPQWKIDEALLLLMRRNPIYVGWEQIAKAGSGSPFARKYAELRMIAIRHIGVPNGQLSDPVDPGVFLRWAQRYKKEVPPELLAAVQEYGHNVRDWQDAYAQKETEIEKWKGAYNILASRIKAQTQKIEDLEAQLQKSVPMPVVAGTEAAGTEAASTGPWPWGTYETEDLRILVRRLR